MKSGTKLGIIVLIILIVLIALSRILIPNQKRVNMNLTVPHLDLTKTFNYEFESSKLGKIIQQDLQGKDGKFGIYVENLNTAEQYTLNEKEAFPAASLYKLVLMAAILKEVEEGRLSLDDRIYGTKSGLAETLGGVDFGYEDYSEDIEFSVDEALTRVGRISDNFAAIMLTNKLRTIRLSGDEGSDSTGLLLKMTANLGMSNTDFLSDPINTTAFDVASYFKRLYNGQIVSKTVSTQIMDYLALSNLNNRIPAKLPEDVKVIHKTGELSKVRHDAGIVYLPQEDSSASAKAYIIVMLSKEVPYEDDAIELMAQISKDVYIYFKDKLD